MNQQPYEPAGQPPAGQPPTGPVYTQEYQPARPASDPIPIVVWALIVANVLVFGLVAMSGGLEGPGRNGVLNAPEIWRGQWWRLFTAMFLHGSLLHLLVNMWALLNLGRDLEAMYGKPRFLLLYFGAGWAGSLASVIFTGMSVGASGAIFGLAGAWLAIALHRRRYFKVFGAQVMGVVIVNLAIGFTASNLIDNNGHIGGLLGGFLLGLLLPNRLPEFQGRWRLPAAGLALLFILASTPVAVQFSRKNLSDRFNPVALEVLHKYFTGYLKPEPCNYRASLK